MYHRFEEMKIEVEGASESLPKISKAMKQRFEVMKGTLAVDLPASCGQKTQIGEFAEFVRQLKFARFSSAQIVFLVHQLVFGQLPTADEIEAHTLYFDNEPEEGFLERLIASDEYRKGTQAFIEYETAPPSRLLVDVSHTLRFGYNSGIQRVVRCLSRNLASGCHPHVLVELDHTTRNYRRVKENEAKSLHDWEHIVVPRESPLNLRMARLKTRVRKLLGRRFKEKFAKLALRARLVKAGGKPDAVATEKVLFVWGDAVLLPELVAEPRSLELIIPLLQQTPVTSSLIVFDMISIKNPEYFLATEGFVRYLALFRCVDRISCISRAVEEDVRHFLPLVDRKCAPPLVDTHYLGGDFPAPDSAAGDGICAGGGPIEKPLVLTVGSIEIRKNHRRILRAMVLAQKEGHQFKGVFAGNPGWLNEGFLRELAYFQNLGFDLELRRSVGEQELLALYQNASFTVYCSLAEGFGLPIVESVVRGVPCITSDRGCMKEIADQLGGCVLADPTSENDISSAIQRLLGEPALLSTLKEEAASAKWTNWAEYAASIYEYSTRFSSRGRAIVNEAA